MTFVPASASRSRPIAAIFSPTIPMSVTPVPSGVTTLPPLTMLSNRNAVLPKSRRQTPDVRRQCSADSAKRVIEHLDGKICIVGRDAHRRLDADNVAVDAALAEQDSHLAATLEQPQRLRLRRLLRSAITHELHAEHQSHSTHVANQRVIVHQLPESRLETTADNARVLLKPVFVDYIENC